MDILVADDEPVVTFVCYVLRMAGHQLVMSDSGIDEVCRTAGSMVHLDILIVGYQVLHRGRQTAERIRLMHPGTRVLQISGWPREHLEAEGALAPGAAFLSKPFTHWHIQQAVESLGAA